MRFKNSNPVRLCNVRSFTSKSGRDLTFLTIADTVTYESLDVLPSSEQAAALTIGDNYYATLLCDGRYNSVVLTPVPKR